MREHYGIFHGILVLVAVLSCEHVNLTLVHSELTDINLCNKDIYTTRERGEHLHEEDIGSLHARVDDLRAAKTDIRATHDRATALNTRERKLSGNVENASPVLFRAYK